MSSETKISERVCHLRGIVEEHWTAFGKRSAALRPVSYLKADAYLRQKTGWYTARLYTEQRRRDGLGKTTPWTT